MDFVLRCDMEVSESCEREMCMWDGARPGLRGRREGREPDRKESSGGGVRDDLLIVAWQPSYFRGKTTRLYLMLFIMLFSETGGLPFCF
jgi:hypothetical protein